MSMYVPIIRWKRQLTFALKHEKVESCLYGKILSKNFFKTPFKVFKDALFTLLPVVALDQADCSLKPSLVLICC